MVRASSAASVGSRVGGDVVGVGDVVGGVARVVDDVDGVGRVVFVSSLQCKSVRVSKGSVNSARGSVLMSRSRSGSRCRSKSKRTKAVGKLDRY